MQNLVIKPLRRVQSQNRDELDCGLIVTIKSTITFKSRVHDILLSKYSFCTLCKCHNRNE